MQAEIVPWVKYSNLFVNWDEMNLFVGLQLTRQPNWNQW
jgi:hypothetical protein